MQENKKNGIFKPCIVDHREALAKANPKLKAIEGIKYLDMLLPLADGVKIPIRIYLPKNSENQVAIPTVFYLPGTGFIASETQFTHVNCTNICQLAKCQVIVIFSRLAPENQFPTGYMDTYQIFKSILSMSNRYLIDKSKVALVGYSSGGNFAALMALQAQKEGIPLNRQVLISGIFDLSRTITAFKQHQDKDNEISESFVRWAIDLYLAPDKNPKDPQISPLWNNSKEIQQLPPTDLIWAEHDRCRGDSEYYFDKLTRAKVLTNPFVFAGGNHTFLWQDIRVTEKIAECLNRAFKNESPRYSLACIPVKKTPNENDKQNFKKAKL